MKTTVLFKRAACLLLMFALALTLCACSVSPASPTPTAAPTSTVAPTQMPTASPTLEPTPEPTVVPLYEMTEYTRAPNENSSVYIKQPWFTDNDWLNEQIMEKMRELAHISVNDFPEGTAITIDYDCAVTFQNSKMVSIVFWGYSDVEGSIHPFSDLIPVTFDLINKTELKLSDMFEINADFEKVFFEKAYYPTNPETSYSADSFSEMLDMQRPISPFSDEGIVTFFAKPDGIVLSMPAVHATGSDHFEAQINLADIESFYLPSTDYWTD